MSNLPRVQGHLYDPSGTSDESLIQRLSEDLIQVIVVSDDSDESDSYSQEFFPTFKDQILSPCSFPDVKSLYSWVSCHPVVCSVTITHILNSSNYGSQISQERTP